MSSVVKPMSSTGMNHTRAKNLLIASRLRESGFKTAYHALKEKFPNVYELIDSELKNGNSFREIINNVERQFSRELDEMVRCGFGRLSIQSLSVFKKNYWINMSGISSVVSTMSKSEVEERFRGWDTYSVLIEIASKSKEIADRTSETDLKLPIGSEIGRKLRREVFDMASVCLDWEIKLGIRKAESPTATDTEIEENKSREVDDKKLDRLEKAIAILREKPKENNSKQNLL